MGAAGCSGQVPRSCSDQVAGWSGVVDELGFPAGQGCAIPGLPSTSNCCSAFPSRNRCVADQDQMVQLPGAVGEQGCQGDVALDDMWNVGGAESNTTGSDAHPNDWSLPDEVGSMEGGDDGVRLARSPMNEPPLPADEDDSDTDSDDRNEAVVEETVPSTNKSSEATLVTDKTAPVSTVVPGTDLDSQESLSVLLTSVRGRPCSICDKEQLPALLISGLHGCGASRSEVPDKASLASDVAASVATVDSASASDTTKPGSPALLESSSVDIALQQESQVGKASEGLDEPSATICLEKPNAGGSPQQWPGIDRDSLHHISDMNLRPPRSRRTRKSSGHALIKNTVNVPRGASRTAHPRGATCGSGGSNGIAPPALEAGVIGKRVVVLVFWCVF